MIDIGVNLTGKAFTGDREAVLQRARDAGVQQLIVTGTTVEESRQAAAMSADSGGYLVSTAGVHPHHAKEWDDASGPVIRELAGHPSVVAVGECGLDYNRNYSSPEDQRRAFAAQLEIARDVQIPVFLHERDAADDFTSILSEHRGDLSGGVIHCFTGNRSALDRYLELDLYVGITGWICDERRGEELFLLAADIPEDRLLIETDAPYLLPRTIRPRPKSRRNEPAFLTHVRDRVAEARGVTPDHVARTTTDNARRLFGI